MALVDNFPGNHQHGSSRLMMIQARFQQRQQEEKEHKLFAMLEEQHDAAAGDGGGGLGLIPATRTHSNGSSNSQHNSASSTASLSSSMGSSLASSLGSTGSGMAVPGGGKVRQMFEDRRNQINGRPPVYSKNAENRKNIPVTTRGWDRSHPLDPLPSNNSHDRNLKVPTGHSQQQQRSRARGVSLERGVHAFGDGPSDSIRRSKSQYQVDDVPGAGMIRSPNKRPTPSDGQPLLNVSATLKPKSMTSLLDDNQNNVNNHSTSNKTIPRFGYNQSPVRNPSQRYQQQNYREDVVDGGNSGRTVGQQYRGRSQTNDEHQTADRTDESSRQAASLAAAAVAAAAETTRRLEREKAQIQAEAKRREEELMNTIRQQQQQLQRLQQAAMLAEQKAKAAAAATATNSRPTRTSYRPPDESDDSKSSVSDDAVISPPSSRGWNPTSTAKKPTVNRNHEMSPPPSAPKPKLAPKPVLESPTPTKSTTTTMPRKSIFATGPSAGGKDGLVSCSLCGRNFASDRIEKHEGICAKTKSKKRKVFDITKMRVKGTEAESFVLAPPGRNNQPNTHTTNNKKPISVGQHILQQQQQATKSAIAPSAKALEDGKKADWRKKHESFIEAIRAAKAMQKHLKAGGKVSDLPPPPPSDTSDYITCPYCQRRFAPGAADRHIPKCSTILSNKKTVRK